MKMIELYFDDLSQKRADPRTPEKLKLLEKSSPSKSSEMGVLKWKHWNTIEKIRTQITSRRNGSKLRNPTFYNTLKGFITLK